MGNIINKLFSDYLSEQKIVGDPEYSALSRQALQKERELRESLSEEQTKCFEELFEITAQLHFLEVKDAFSQGCRLGAKASKEFII